MMSLRYKEMRQGPRKFEHNTNKWDQETKKLDF